MKPSKQRRKALRALARATATANRIHGDSNKRQRIRAEGEAYAAGILDVRLEDLYSELRVDRRMVYAAGLPEGTSYRGRTGAIGRGR